MKNLLSKEDESILSQLCLSNGIDESCLNEQGFKYEKLEIFFSGFPRIIPLYAFPNLNHLVIFNQTINVIENLDFCTNLVSLWICECEITEIEGLEQCRQIRTLYLYDNKITKIQNLYSLRLLEILWLNNNKIEIIEGLEELVILKDLNLAGNSIKKIGNSLRHNVSIEKLNLSGNKLEYINDLLNLSKLPKLKYLIINGPDFIPNPLFYHTNFYLFMIYHFHKLKRIDTFDVGSNYLKDITLNIINKKKLFYFMKRESLERDKSFKKLQLHAAYDNICKYPKARLVNLWKLIKLIEMVSTGKEVNETKKNVVENLSLISKEEYNDDLMEIKSRINKIEILIESYHNELEFYLRKIDDAHSEERSLYQMEFSSCGNLKFEISTDKIWVNLCNELINSRYCSSEFDIDDFQHIKTRRVIKIKNAQVENHYLKMIQDIMIQNGTSDQTDTVEVTMQDYLFLLVDEEGDERDLKSVLESVYSSSDNEVVKLTNSLYNGDLLSRREKALPSTSLYGRVILVKAFVGFLKETDPEDFCLEKSEWDSTEYSNTVKIPIRKCRYKLCSCSDYKYYWYFKNNKLLVPEYVVDFEYITDKDDEKSRLYFTFHEDKKHISNPKPCHVSDPDKDLNGFKAKLEIQRAKQYSIDLIHKMNSENFSSITMINFTDCHLKSIPEIISLPNLTQLIIPFNELINLRDISNKNLRVLDVGFNRIQSLQEMHELLLLSCFNVQNNFLVRTEDEIFTLQSRVPNLTNLNVKNNFFQKPETLRWRIFGRFPLLQLFNNLEVDEDEMKLARNLFSNNFDISDNLIFSHGRSDAIRPRTLLIDNIARVLQLDHDSRVIGGPDDCSRFLRITSICLDSQSISKISNFERLENLKFLSLADNFLSKIEGLDYCTQLEELILDNNTISKIENVTKLEKLKKISLNNNYISSVWVLKNLSNLQTVSVHTNRIMSFNGLDSCAALTELYGANNDVEDFSDIFMLKILTNLVILDLFNNPINRIDKNYRLNLIFNLKNLKCLDNTCVEQAEINQSREMFGGRLNLDFITDKVGHEKFDVLSELDLSNCSLKTVDLSPVQRLSHLQCFNLENNNLTSFSGLADLSNLKILCLNGNSIESIVPKFASSFSSSKIGGGPTMLEHGATKVNLKSLEVLHLGYNNIKSLAALGLSDIPSLRTIFLQGNDISSIEGLENLPNLRELVLDQNRIKSVSALAFIGNPRIEEIHLDDNRLNSLTNLLYLRFLKRLYLANNKLTDLHELDAMIGSSNSNSTNHISNNNLLESLVDISLHGNPIARRCQHRSVLIHLVPSLVMIDGVEITEEERLKIMQSTAEESNVDGNLLPGILNPSRSGCAGNVKQQTGNFSNSNDFIKTDCLKVDSNYKKKSNGTTSFNGTKVNSIPLGANTKAIYFYDSIVPIESIPRLNFKKK